MNKTPEEIEQLLSHFDLNARVEFGGKSYTVPREAIIEASSSGDHTSSWFITSFVSNIKYRYHPPLPRVLAIKLCAMAMKSTEQSVEDTLDWNANYMAWHDGGIVEENHAWPPEAENGSAKSDS